MDDGGAEDETDGETVDGGRWTVDGEASDDGVGDGIAEDRIDDGVIEGKIEDKTDDKIEDGIADEEDGPTDEDAESDDFEDGRWWHRAKAPGAHATAKTVKASVCWSLILQRERAKKEW
ncbi:hypothetical protein B0T14DRAFT_566322 [Immersiella caudata]|uniref:Uncharacterized protein n=1 Tax=Immersiella caudata TaxID=314043 RepID=A0AA40BZR3_9PEZI|nr:hypothetical protein B0T14DRAFT_566322 [Immersiella caudata]